MWRLPFLPSVILFSMTMDTVAVQRGGVESSVVTAHLDSVTSVPELGSSSNPRVAVEVRSGNRYLALMRAANSYILSSTNGPLLQRDLPRGNKCPPSAVSPPNLTKPSLKRSLRSAVHLKRSSSPGLRIMCHLPPTHEWQQLRRMPSFAQGADTSNRSGSRWGWCQPPGLQIPTRLSQMLNFIGLLEILIHLSNTPSYAAMVH